MKIFNMIVEERAEQIVLEKDPTLIERTITIFVALI